jgi:hypothetical protein
MTEEKDSANRRWIDDAEEAVNRATDALRAAWDESREARMSTLESAREAVTKLGSALDQGIEAARKNWNPSETAPTSESPDETGTQGS